MTIWHFDPNRITKMKRKKDRTAVKLANFVIWIICGSIVAYQGIKCIKKYLENPKGSDISMVDSVGQMFPHFTFCPSPFTPWNLAEVNCSTQKW